MPGSSITLVSSSTLGWEREEWSAQETTLLSHCLRPHSLPVPTCKTLPYQWILCCLLLYCRKTGIIDYKVNKYYLFVKEKSRNAWLKEIAFKLLFPMLNLYKSGIVWYFNGKCMTCSFWLAVILYHQGHTVSLLASFILHFLEVMFEEGFTQNVEATLGLCFRGVQYTMLCQESNSRHLYSKLVMWSTLSAFRTLIMYLVGASRWKIPQARDDLFKIDCALSKSPILYSIFIWLEFQFIES